MAKTSKESAGSPKKILIVEDEPSFLLPLKEKFEETGFNVLTAPDGQQGLEMAKKEIPDLIIVDILLPKLDGMSMAKEINKLNLGIPMIFLTNLSDLEHISEGISINDTDYMIKSDYNINDIVKRVKQKLEIK